MVRHYHYQFNVLEKIEDLIVGELKSRKVKNLEAAKKKVLNIYLRDIDVTNKRKLIRQYINVDFYANFIFSVYIGFVWRVHELCNVGICRSNG